MILWFCGGTLFSTSRPTGTHRLIVYGFSILAEPLRDEIFPLFRDKWRRDTGQDVEFTDSFAASGTVANQIINGTPADIGIFAHAGDADRVAQAGRAAGDWRAAPNGGILNRTPFVIVVRPGNPKKIDAFAALGAPGVQVVHPDPMTSGGAQWAIVAEWAEPLMLARAAGRQAGEDVAAAQLSSIWRNVVAQAPSARAAMTQFDQGFGDALVTYEVEALLDVARGHGVEVVVPAATILSEHPVVLIDRAVDDRQKKVARAFADFLFTPEAQRAFVRHGFRSIYPALDAENPKLAPLKHAYTAAELGGFERLRRDVIDGVWRNRLATGAPSR